MRASALAAWKPLIDMTLARSAPRVHANDIDASLATVFCAVHSAVGLRQHFSSIDRAVTDDDYADAGTDRLGHTAQQHRLGQDIKQALRDPVDLVLVAQVACEGDEFVASKTRDEVACRHRLAQPC